MKNLMCIILVGAFCVTLNSCGKKIETDNKEIAEDQNDQKFTDSDVKEDAEFAVEAAEAGMFEVMLGEVAAANGLSGEVKKLGKTMVDEHTKAYEELKALAATKSITLPAGLSDELQKKYEDISSKRGVEFDKAYADAMQSGHKDIIDVFKKEADKGNDPDIKGWAAGKIPTLEHHLMMAQETHKIVKDLED